MKEISELENRLKGALAVIDSAISDNEGVADIVELRRQNAELKTGIETAEQAAAAAEARLAETAAELELAKHFFRSRCRHRRSRRVDNPGSFGP